MPSPHNMSSRLLGHTVRLWTGAVPVEAMEAGDHGGDRFRCRGWATLGPIAAGQPPRRPGGAVLLHRVAAGPTGHSRRHFGCARRKTLAGPERPNIAPAQRLKSDASLALHPHGYNTRRTHARRVSVFEEVRQALTY